ncbi:hypothetical protein BGX23_002176 [Mortierella sp. AD031]|nr:hypothetical protein BGX23_002176 [Mortierella sp. AD031]
MLQADTPQESVQALRAIDQTGTPSEVIHIETHLDVSGKEVVLWDDILVAFENAINVRHQTKVVQYLKGPDLRALDPLRIAAIRTLSWISTRNPDYDPMEMANTLLKEFNIPMAPPRGPQTDSDNATGNYTLHDHSIVIQPSVSTTTNNTPHRAPHVSVKNSTGDGTIIIEDMAETMFKAKKGDMKAQVKLGSPT